jgi:hypothetical protein
MFDSWYDYSSAAVLAAAMLGVFGWLVSGKLFRLLEFT